MSNLFCVAVSAKSSVTVVVPDDRDLIITRAALSGHAAGATVLLMKGEQDQAFVLGTFRSPQCEQFELDINIAAGSSVDFSVTGPNEVHLTGYHSALGYDDYSGSEFSSDEEGLSGLLDMEGYHSSQDDDFSSGEIESLDEDEDVSVDSDDDEMEEDSPKKPVQQKNFPPAQTFQFGVDKKAEAKKPETKKPEAAKPQAKKPEPAKETKKPEAKKPEATKPSPAKAEAAKPEAKKPATPEGKGQKRAPGTPEDQPQNKKQKTEASPSTGAFKCSCGKTFAKEAGRDQHCVATKHTAA